MYTFCTQTFLGEVREWQHVWALYRGLTVHVILEVVKIFTLHL